MKHPYKPRKYTTTAEKSEIFQDWMQSGSTQKVLAEKYGISMATVSKIIGDIMRDSR